MAPHRNRKMCCCCDHTTASFFSMCTGGGRKERRRYNQLVDGPLLKGFRTKLDSHPSILLVILVVTMISQTTGGDLPYSNNESSILSPISLPLPVPDDCYPTTYESGLALECSLSAINSAEEKTNFSVIPSEHTIKLTVKCQSTQIISNLEADGFRSLQHLRHLVIENCNLQSIPSRSFWGLHDLETLKVAISRKAQGILRIQVDAFYGVDKLKKLDLSNNRIQQFSINTLCPLNNLNSLNVSNNHLQSLSDIEVTDGCLGSVQILDLSYNQINGELNNEQLQLWSSVSTLILKNNYIEKITGDSLNMLKVTLRTLDLSENRIESLPEDVFSQGHYISWIDLSKNAIHDLPKKIFKHQHQTLKHLNLSRNNLKLLDKNVFANLSQLSNLDLSQNFLETLHPKAFEGLKHLEHLNLGYNYITNFHPVLLSDLIKLQSLCLSGNRLTTLPDDAFSNLASLSHLLLDSNQLENQLNPNVFNKVKNHLKILDLSQNKLKEISSALKGLSGGSLQSLSISDNFVSNLKSIQLSSLWRLQASNNSLSNMTLISFRDLPGLQVLDLSKNQISRIKMGTFQSNKALQAIRLDGNRLEQMQGLFQDLPNLSWLNISDNKIEMFDYAMIPKSLQWLDIHQNKITGLENYFSSFDDTNKDERKLANVDASFNHIQELGPQNVPNSIESLALNDNDIETIVPYTFFKKERLKHVDLTLNKMKSIDRNSIRLSSDLTSKSFVPKFYLGGNPLRCDCHMAWFKSINKGNSVQNYPIIADLESIYCQLLHSKESNEVIPLVEANADDFLCSYQTHCFALCHCCDYDACDCEMTCPGNCTCFHDNPWTKNIADCSSSNFHDLPDHLPMDSTEIFLDGNNMNELRSHDFIGRKNLKTLYLNNSNILSVENHTFNGLTVLEELHLENNMLRKLQGDEFHGLEALRKLFLQNNLLRTINNSTFNGLDSLEVLFLHGNRLFDFPVWILSEDVKSLSTLSLVNNRWSCDCKFIRRFQNWLLNRQNRELVEDVNSLYCSKSLKENANRVFDGSSVIASSIMMNREDRLVLKRNVTECDLAETSEIQMFDRGYNSNLSYLPLLISTLICLTLIIIGLVTVYIYRNEARIWLYSRYGIRFFQRIDAVADSEKIFDAFLTYSAEDDVFVRQILAPELEQGGGNYIPYPNQYKLCLFYRDLPLQVCLADLIIQANESSKRTIVVLSENFIKSEWSRYDFKSGLHQALRATGNRKPIIIMLGDIPSREIDPDLRLYLKNGTILYWGSKSFWEKLKYLLPDVSKGGHTIDDTYSFRYETIPRRAYDATSPSEEDSTRTMTLHI